MSAFEHIMVLLSFVYALAIGHLLSTVAGLIRNSARVRFSWIHAFWLLNALITIIADWIGFWDMRALPSWGIATIIFTLLMGIVNYVQAALVCDEIPAQGPIDLVEFHAQQGQRYMAAFAASSLIALAANWVYGGAYGLVQWNAENLAVVPMTVIAIAVTLFRARWIQVAAPVLLLAIWGYYFADLQGALH